MNISLQQLTMTTTELARAIAAVTINPSAESKLREVLQRMENNARQYLCTGKEAETRYEVWNEAELDAFIEKGDRYVDFMV